MRIISSTNTYYNTCLQDIEAREKGEHKKAEALTILTYIGMILSMVGILLSLLTLLGAK